MKPIHNIFLESTDSTNNYVKQHLSSYSENKIYCVTAQEQTAGRGRFAKTWVSPKGENIYASLYFTIGKDYPYLQNLSQILAISCAEVFHKFSIPAKLKWPNDILVHKKKIAGILTETISFEEKIGVILGIGVNINMSEKTMKSISQPATSLKCETGKKYDVRIIWEQIIGKFLENLALLELNGFHSFSKFYTENLAFQGEKIRVSHGNKIVEGICKKITLEGTLLLVDDYQNVIEVSTGELSEPSI